MAIQLAAQLLRRLSGLDQLFVLVSGPTGAGKSAIAHALRERLERRSGRKVALVKLDRYFKVRSARHATGDGAIEIDHPDSLNWDWVQDDLDALRRGDAVDLPHFGDSADDPDGTSVRHSGTIVSLGPGDILIIESLFAFRAQALGLTGEGCTVKVYLDAPWPVRLLRRLWRERAWFDIPAADILRDWHSVRRTEERFVLPQQGQANIVQSTYLHGDLRALHPSLSGYLDEAKWAFDREPAGLALIDDLRLCLAEDGGSAETAHDTALDALLDPAGGMTEGARWLLRCSNEPSRPQVGLRALADDELFDVARVLVAWRQSLSSIDKAPRRLFDLSGACRRVLRDRFLALQAREPKAPWVRWLAKIQVVAAADDEALVRALLDVLVEGQTSTPAAEKLGWNIVSLLVDLVPLEGGLQVVGPSGLRRRVPYDPGWPLAARQAMLTTCGRWLAAWLSSTSTVFGRGSMRVEGDYAAGQELIGAIKGTDAGRPRADRPQGPATSHGCVVWQPEGTVVEGLRHPGYPMRKLYCPVRAPRRKEWRTKECLFCSLDTALLVEGATNLLEQWGVPYWFAVNGFPYFRDHWMAIDLCHNDSSVTQETLEDAVVLATLLQMDLFVSEQGASHDEHLHFQCVGEGLAIHGAREERYVSPVPGVALSGFPDFPGSAFVLRSYDPAALLASAEQLRTAAQRYSAFVGIAVFDERPLRVVLFPRVAAVSVSTGIRVGTNELLGHWILTREQFTMCGLDEILQAIRDVVAPKAVSKQVYEGWFRWMRDRTSIG